MSRVSLTWTKRRREFNLGADADWQTAAKGFELGLNFGLWSIGIALKPKRDLADRMIEALKK